MSSSELPANEIFTKIVLEVFRLNGALLHDGNKITQSSGLTSSRWQVMGAIEEADKSLSVSQIANRMGLSRQSVQRIVNSLKKNNMVSLKDNIKHKQARVVELTVEGKESLKQVNKIQFSWATEMSSEIKPEELTQALKTLGRLRKKLESSR